MNIALSPQTIPIAWQDYLSRNYDPTLIPWLRYRYSGTGVVEVSVEAIHNHRIAQSLRDLLNSEMTQLSMGGEVIVNAIGVEVERSQKEERIPDVLVISEECVNLLGRESHIITLDMPAPILVVEVVSPSSVKDDLEEKPFEMMDRGVGEYVSIDWRKESVQVWSYTGDGKNYNFCEYHSGERVRLKSFPSLVITVDEMILK